MDPSRKLFDASSTDSTWQADVDRAYEFGVLATAAQLVGPGLADAAAILLAAEQVGAAARCLELTVDYTKERQQFGRAIGSVQAVKHRMADLYVAVQAARAVVNDAADAPSATSAALARVAASEAFSTVAAEGIQPHSGLAITCEHDMQLYFKRAQGSSQLLGPPRDHLRRPGIRTVLARPATMQRGRAR